VLALLAILASNFHNLATFRPLRGFLHRENLLDACQHARKWFKKCVFLSQIETCGQTEPQEKKHSPRDQRDVIAAKKTTTQERGIFQHEEARQSSSQANNFNPGRGSGSGGSGTGGGNGIGRNGYLV